MKFKISSCLFTFIASTLCYDAAMASCDTAPAGRYCEGVWFISNVEMCPSGCYCTGGGRFNWMDGDVDRGCSNRWDKVTTELNKYGVFLCPADYPNSGPGSKTTKDCFTYDKSNRKAYYDTPITCKAGNYLPANSAVCNLCKNKEGNNYFACPGGDYKFNKTKDSGIIMCGTDEQTNSDRSGCIKPTTKCDPGYYLPASATSCTQCRDRYYCPGGSFIKKSSDQGLIKCQSGEISNATYTACIKEEVKKTVRIGENIVVDPGFYLPANSDSPRACSGATKYCPGGEYSVKSVDQGIFACPFNSKPTSDKSGCLLVVNANQMKYGIDGGNANSANQCWSKTDPDEYQKCLYGVKYKYE